jgi:CheY-like chemotaxis protein
MPSSCTTDCTRGRASYLAAQEVCLSIQSDNTAKRRVLIADDNYDAAVSLAILLGQSGNDVRLAHDGQTAISMARQFKPHIAILDIGMPGLTGYQVAQHIRAESWAHRTVLVALTGWGQPADRQVAFEAGFDHHLTKPAEPDAIERLVDSALTD